MGPLLEMLTVQASAFVLALAALGLGIAWQRRDPRPRRFAGLVLIAGLVGATLAQTGLPRVPFGEGSLRASDRLFWLLLAAVPFVLSTWRHALIPLALVLPVVIADAFGELGLAGGAWVVTLALPLGTAALVLCGDGLFRARPGRTSAVQLGLWVGLASGAIGATGSAAYASWLGGLGLAYGLTVLRAWRKGTAGHIDGGSTALWTAGFLFMAQQYSYLDAMDALLVAAALPLSLLASALPLKPAPRLVLGWLLLLAPIAWAGVRMYLAWEPDPYAGYY